MKTVKTLTNALTLISLAVLVSLLIALWQSRQVHAIQDSEDFPSDFGFVDLGAGQTARLNVINLRRQPPPDPDTPPPDPDQPPPDPKQPQGNRRCWCEALKCLLGQKSILELLRRHQIDPAALRCLVSCCRHDDRRQDMVGRLRAAVTDPVAFEAVMTELDNLDKHRAED